MGICIKQVLRYLEKFPNLCELLPEFNINSLFVGFGAYTRPVFNLFDPLKPLFFAGIGWYRHGFDDALRDKGVGNSQNRRPSP